ncbi:MAG: SOS response-associated peptidase, partial [Delftia acidovorans]|nr:SOS response-associated peptidase [Delftia acidovorans]
MSTHYESLSQADAYRDAFDVEAPAASERNMTPRKSGFFIRSVAVAAEAAAEQAEPAAPDTPPAAPTP